MTGFDQRSIRRWRKEVWRIYQREGFLAPQIPAAMLLAAVASFGTDVSVLCEITGSSRDYVKKILKRLRANRVLSGQTIKTPWAHTDDFYSHVGAVLDGLVAAGELTRPPDAKRSASQKARAPETRHHGRRRARVIIADGTMFTPKVQLANPKYGLANWDKSKRSE